MTLNKHATMPKSFYYIFIHWSQQLGSSSSSWRVYLSLFLFSFGYDYLFFYLREKRESFVRKVRHTTAAAAAGQVSIAPPCWPTTNCKNPTHTKQTKTKDVETFHFFISFSNNPTSLAKASDNVNHPYWFNAFLGF